MKECTKCGVYYVLLTSYLSCKQFLGYTTTYFIFQAFSRKYTCLFLKIYGWNVSFVHSKRNIDIGDLEDNLGQSLYFLNLVQMMHLISRTCSDQLLYFVKPYIIDVQWVCYIFHD